MNRGLEARRTERDLSVHMADCPLCGLVDMRPLALAGTGSKVKIGPWCQRGVVLYEAWARATDCFEAGGTRDRA